MGLFDILANPEIRSILTSLAGQAQDGMRQMGQKVPQGMGGLFGAGALGALLGGILPKGATKTAGMLGLGVLALNFYKKWAAQQGGKASSLSSQADPFGGDAFAYTGPMNGQEAANDPTAILLLRAMIFAARADGHIDAAEEERIAKVLPQFFPDGDVRPILQRLLEESLDTSVLAREVSSQEQAEDLYRLSCVIVDIDHFMERGYFVELAESLHISPERARQLEAEAVQAKRQLESF